MQSLNGTLHEAMEHWLLTHLADPLVTEHDRPQPPHAVTVLVVLVSQPLETCPSQLPQPVLQEMEQTPSEHEGVPLTVEQAELQAPQCSGLVDVLTSQPFESSPSQLANGATQERTLQTPVVQVVVALGSVQAMPQSPQLPVVLTLVSHPSA